MTTNGIVKKERVDNYDVQVLKIAYCSYETSVVGNDGEMFWIAHSKTKKEALKAYTEAKLFLRG